MPFSSSKALALCILTIQFWSLHATQVCYWPDGTVPRPGQATQLPCNDQNGATHCCSNYDACLKNGLCFAGSIGVPYRGSCTDPTWKSPNCPDLCNDIASNTWANLINCPSNGKFWCGNVTDPGSCQSGTSASFYQWPTPGGVQTVLGGAAATTSKTAGPTSTADSNSITDLPAATTAAAVPSQPLPSATASQSGVSTATAVGAGVGVPLGVLVIGLLTLLFWRERRKIAAKKAGTTQMGWPTEIKGGSGPAPQPSYSQANGGFVSEKDGPIPATELPGKQDGLSQELDGRDYGGTGWK